MMASRTQQTRPSGSREEAGSPSRAGVLTLLPRRLYSHCRTDGWTHDCEVRIHLPAENVLVRFHPWVPRVARPTWHSVCHVTRENSYAVVLAFRAHVDIRCRRGKSIVIYGFAALCVR